MFGMGGSEIIVILIIALIFLGPDKLPEAAKSISKGIRDIKKQSRSLQQSIEDDEVVGGAIRDLKSALRGEEASIRPPKVIKPLKRPEITDPAVDLAGAPLALAATGDGASPSGTSDPDAAAGEPDSEASEPRPAITLPATAGEADPRVADDDDDDGASLASLIRPAAGTVAKGEAITEPAGETTTEPDVAVGSGGSGREHG